MRINAETMREKADAYYEIQRLLDVVLAKISEKAAVGKYNYYSEYFEKSYHRYEKYKNQIHSVKKELEQLGFKCSTQDNGYGEFCLEVSWDK